MYDYKHGTYGELIPVSATPATSPSCVVYVGTAPAHKIKGQSENQSGLFNLPLRINTLNVARKLLGYSEEAPIEKYTLCEAVEAHFKNAIETVGPIYCINVLNPNLEENYFEDTEGIKLDVLKKQTKFILGDLVLDSIQIESADEVVPPEPPIEEGEDGGEQGQEPVEGEDDQEPKDEGNENPSGQEGQEPNEGGEEGEEISVQSEEIETPSSSLQEDQDYTLSYDSSTDMVTLTFMGEVIPKKILVKGKIVNPMAIGADEIIGEVTEDGHKTGLQAIKDIHPKHDEITNLIAAPGFSDIPEVYEAMCKVAVKLNGHWDAFVNADLPLKDGLKDIDTIKKAVKWKKEHGYDNGRSKVYWPQAPRKNGKRVHLSTMATAKMQALDLAAKGVPYQSPSNQAIDIVDIYGGENFAGFDQSEANELNENGITTAVHWGGKWRLWGNHTAAYSYEDEDAGIQDPTTQFDTAIRTMMHITNRFQVDNFDLIDQPMTNAIKDFIIQKEQSKLDALVSTGALLGQPKIYFSEDNSPEQIMGGNFAWDISATTGIPFKSGTVRLGYTNTGVYTLLGEEE